MRNNRPSAALCEMLEEIGLAPGLEEALVLLDRRLRPLLPYDRMAVFVSREGALVPAYVSGVEPRLCAAIDSPGSSGIVARVAGTGRPAFNRDPCEEPGAGAALRSMIAVPLDDGVETAGVLALYSAETNVFQPVDLGVLLWIRADLARAIRIAGRRGRLKPDFYDLLTGLPNERGLFLRLDAWIARCRGSGESMAVMLCGVDGLAGVQARFGAPAAARLVQAIAAGLRGAASEKECVARFGEEFVLLLARLSAEENDRKQASMAALVEGVGLAHFGERLLSIRSGTAWFPEDASDAEGLLAVAGRRQQVMTPPLPRGLADELANLRATLDATAVRVA